MADNSLWRLPKGFLPYEELSGMSDTEPILVAFSGGADSRALFDVTARICREKGTFFYACHVNHGIRGDEAIRDRDFCISVAKACPECKEIFVLDADVPSLAKESGRSLELEARLLRYAFFNKIMKENGISLLATAHNADDNLETLIFNLTRGSGARGMCGIPSVREIEGGLVLRPMLGMSKAEILDYCRENSLEYVTDSTNADTDYSRNLIRAKVIPLLEELNPGVRASAQRLSDNMKSLCAHASEEAKKYLTPEGIPVKDLNEAHPSLLPFIFTEGAKRVNADVMPESSHITALTELCKKAVNGSSVSLPCSIRGKIRNGLLIFEPDTGRCSDVTPDDSFSIRLEYGENLLPSGDSIFVCKSRDDIPKIYKSATQTALRHDTIITCLTARSRLAGDRILQGGMHKSVKKLMCDKKISPDKRNTLPLVCDGEEILWIPHVATRDGITGRDGDMILIYKTTDMKG